eukprot:GABU01003808.1.p1 GENE.GABU01003808.1~~GABU01003808.1.p1  ORF type:complete len:113 (-),score=44.00 GABU01003808.1:195-533(-)
MNKIRFEHGGAEFDSKYPDGIPTSLEVTLKDGSKLATDMVMYPPGHARNTTSDLKGILKFKFSIMGKMGLEDAELTRVLTKLEGFETLTSADLLSVYECHIQMAPESLDQEA